LRVIKKKKRDDLVVLAGLGLALCRGHPPP